MTQQSGPAVTANSVHTIHVDLQQRSYDILVGQGLLAHAGAHLAPLLRRPECVIVTDHNVAPLHLAPLQEGLKAAGIASQAIILEPGEASKSFATLEILCAQLLEANVERGDTVIALGGGVIGDLTGFAASILRRGVDFIQVPTTLLAQVDSSVGGKTGINMAQGKNLIGAFHQPRLVLADIDTLDTLPRRDLLSGYAEVVKYGLIDDIDFFQWLEINAHALIEGQAAARIHAVETSCQAKAAIVASDERESGKRALLNFGHTFGHALEAETGYSGHLQHGEAVGIGMVLAHQFSNHLGLSPTQETSRLEAHLRDIGLKSSIDEISGAPFSTSRLIDHMYQDKKVSNAKLTFILTRGIGQAFVMEDVDAAKLKTFLTNRE